MQILFNYNGTHVLHVQPNTSVTDFKSLVTERTGIPMEDQVFAFNGKALLNDKTLADYDMTGLEVVELNAKLLGGKVHGSLARAGKVRGQTPKVGEVQGLYLKQLGRNPLVDKKEKRKGVTGRAKRRLQYNKRFRNVVVSFGRKRGPNSNADRAM